MSKPYFTDTCDDPECMFCQDDDGDAAFWDEFFYASEEEDVKNSTEVLLTVLDDDTGELIMVENVDMERTLPIFRD